MQEELSPYKYNITVETFSKSTYILTDNIHSPKLVTVMLAFSKGNIRDFMGRAEVTAGNFTTQRM